MSEQDGDRPESDLWELELFEHRGKIPYQAFVLSLPDYERAVVDVAVQRVLRMRGLDVCETEWGKPLGKGLYEFRVRRSLSVIYREAGLDPPAEHASDDPVLLRVFFATAGRKVLLLLSGYDKQRDSSSRRQDKEIKTARKLLKAYQSEARKIM